MRQVTQTITYDPDMEAVGVYGNCMQAAFASLLDPELDALLRADARANERSIGQTIRFHLRRALAASSPVREERP